MSDIYDHWAAILEALGWEIVQKRECDADVGRARKGDRWVLFSHRGVEFNQFSSIDEFVIKEILAKKKEEGK